MYDVLVHAGEGIRAIYAQYAQFTRCRIYLSASGQKRGPMMTPDKIICASYMRHFHRICVIYTSCDDSEMDTPIKFSIAVNFDIFQNITS